MHGGAVPDERELVPRRRATQCGPASRFGKRARRFWVIDRSNQGGVRMADKHADVSAVEKIKQASHGLRGSLAPELASATRHFEDEAAQLLKFHGVSQQDDRDTRRQRSDAGLDPAYAFMVRCKIPGGVVTAEQYLALDELAGRYGNGTLRVTTRQDNQFHSVVKGDLKATIRALNDALVTTLGACGDVQRNVMCCPAPLPGGLRDQALAVARHISARLLPRTRAYHEIWLNGDQVAEGAPAPEPIYGQRYLPRKFKTAIAFSDDNCTDVYSNDLGFVVIPDGDSVAGFNVLVGGGLGMTHGKKVTYPRLADPLGFATPEDVVAVAEAVITLQRDYGDRSDRRHALPQVSAGRPGARLVPGAGGAAARPATAAARSGPHQRRARPPGVARSGRRQLVLRAVHRKRAHPGYGGCAAPDRRPAHRGSIPGRRPLHAAAEPAAHGHRRAAPGRAGRDAGGPRRAPGGRHFDRQALPTCGLALAEAERALPGVIDELEGELERLGLADLRLTVRMTGCPNGCARPYTADLAFVGRSADKFTIFV